jgi:hypothetical protein
MRYERCRGEMIGGLSDFGPPSLTLHTQYEVLLEVNLHCCHTAALLLVQELT